MIEKASTKNRLTTSQKSKRKTPSIWGRRGFNKQTKSKI